MLQIIFKPCNNVLLNYSTFFGTDKQDYIKAFRQFHNFFVQSEPTKTIGFIAGFDFGIDKYNTTNYGTWYSPVLILKYNINRVTRFAIRGEYYSDPKQIIISTGTINGFQTFGLSSNFDYDLNEKIKFRFESKIYQSKDKIFANNNNNFSLTTNMTIQF